MLYRFTSFIGTKVEETFMQNISYITGKNVKNTKKEGHYFYSLLHFPQRKFLFLLFTISFLSWDKAFRFSCISQMILFGRLEEKNNTM